MRKTGKPIVSAATLVTILQNIAIQDIHFQQTINSFSVTTRKTKGSKSIEGKTYKVRSRYPERKPTHAKEMARRCIQIREGIIPSNLVHKVISK